MSQLGRRASTSSLGRKASSTVGSRLSLYSHARSTHGGREPSHTHPAAFKPWYLRPVVKSACYTDLQRGAWHSGFYTFFLSIFTIFTSGFDLYCLHEATPGYSHTGYYIISFDFVYVGNPHVRNLLIMSSVFSFFGGVALVITSVMLLDALRKEQETAFKAWLSVMLFFTPWKFVSWVYFFIVNDLLYLYVYNILMTVFWLVFNVLDVAAFCVVYSLYLELNDVTNLQDIARLKFEGVNAFASRGNTSRASSAMAGEYSNVLADIHSGAFAQLPHGEDMLKMDTLSGAASRGLSSMLSSRPTSPYAHREDNRHQIYAQPQPQQQKLLDSAVEIQRSPWDQPQPQQPHQQQQQYPQQQQWPQHQYEPQQQQPIHPYYGSQC